MSMWKFGLPVGLGLMAAAALSAQEKLPAPVAPPAVSPNQPAATVNGQVIYEAAVMRGLKRVPPIEHEKARPEILNYLVENTLIDQHLAAAKVDVTPAEADARMNEIKAELKKANQDFSKLLASMSLSEDEMKAQIIADLRWEKYVASQASEAVLRQKYEQNLENFDGTLVRVRHVLVPTPDAKVTPDQAKLAVPADQAQARLKQIKDYLESVASAEVAKLPATADPLTRDEVRLKKLEETFAKLAPEHSACPSKAQGGDLNWFPRGGAMVEPFAKAAFAMKVGQISDPVRTPFGYHLILVTGRKPGQPTKFEDVKDAVQEWYSFQLRTQLLEKIWPTAKVTYGK
jgi:parvulin-like peptidyl-prolyl isomerase